jgi:hypothetical protein
MDESAILGSYEILMPNRLNGKGKGEDQEVSKHIFLDVKPIRNSEVRWVKNQQGFITLLIPLKQPQKKRRKSVFSMFSSSPQEKKLQLDSLGSVIWELCDGEKSVKDIVQFLNNMIKMQPNEAEVSLNIFLDQLSKRGLLTYIAAEETNPHIEELTKK